MLARFGAGFGRRGIGGRRDRASRRGRAAAAGRSTIPGDPSAAAFLIVAALIVPGSELRIEGVGVNPMRTGLFDAAPRRWAATSRSTNEREQDGEPVADLVVRHSPLRGDRRAPGPHPGDDRRIPDLLRRRRLRRGDQPGAAASPSCGSRNRTGSPPWPQGLRAIGARVEESEDGLAIEGSGGAPLAGGATIDLAARPPDRDELRGGWPALPRSR